MKHTQRILFAAACIGASMTAAALPQFVPAEPRADWLGHLADSHWQRASGRLGQTPSDAWVVTVNKEGGGDSVKSLEEAQAKVRAILADIRGGKKPPKPVVVRIAAGTYPLAKPLHFTPDDGGDEKFPVSYVADAPGKVIITGGVPMQEAAGSGGRLKYDLPAGLNVDWTVPHDLFVGGRRATLAREPNTGTDWYVQPGAPKGDKSTVMVDPHAQQWIGALSSDDRARAELFLYHSWTTSMHRFDASGNALKLAMPSKWPTLQFGKVQRYFIENVAAALDAPGEWLGAGREVTYIPVGAEGGAHPVAVIPVTPKLIEIAGTSKGQVNYISFVGLHLMHTERNPDEASFVDGQAAMGVGAAVEVDHARHIDFKGVQLSHLGGFGIWMRSDVADSTIDDGVIEDAGAGGIKIGTTGPAVSPETDTRNITITNNVIAHTGLIFPGAVALWVGWADDNHIEKNLIADTTYAGMSIGWKWGFGGPASKGNHINRNVLFDIGQANLSDFGAIYTLGESPGTEVTGNLVREVRSFPGYGGKDGLGAFGIYLDEGSSGIHVANNVVVGTDSGGFHINYGHDDLVENNILADGEQSEVSLFHDKGGKSLDFRGNSLFPLVATPFVGALQPSNSSFAGNAVAAPESGRLDAGVCSGGCTASSARINVGRGLKDIQISGGSGGASDTLRRVLSDAGPAGDQLNDIPVAERRPPPALRHPMNANSVALGAEPALGPTVAAAAELVARAR